MLYSVFIQNGDGVDTVADLDYLVEVRKIDKGDAEASAERVVLHRACDALVRALVVIALVLVGKRIQPGLVCVFIFEDFKMLVGRNVFEVFVLGDNYIVGPFFTRPIDNGGVVANCRKLFTDFDDLAFAVVFIHHDLDDVEIVDGVKVAVYSVDDHEKGTDKDHTGDKDQNRCGGHNAVAENALKALTKVIEKYARLHSVKSPPI